MARTAPAASFESLESDLDQKFAYPASSKTYLTGSRPDIRVPLRTILQTSTRTDKGEMSNPPIPVYDTSGPYSDPDVHIDLKAGLPALRAKWIDERGDTEVLKGLSSEYGRDRANDPATAHLRFAQLTNPRRAKAGANVSQMHYARKGIITPEMEYVALRESLNLQALYDKPEYKALLRQHPGNALAPGCRCVRKTSRRSSCATRSPRAARSFPPTSTTPSWSRWRSGAISASRSTATWATRR